MIWVPMCNQMYRRMTKDLYSYLNYSQISLNLPEDYCLFFFLYIFLWMVTTVAPKENSLKKNTGYPV
jgi:hypothetical protein